MSARNRAQSVKMTRSSSERIVKWAHDGVGASQTENTAERGTAKRVSRERATIVDDSRPTVSSVPEACGGDTAHRWAR